MKKMLTILLTLISLKVIAPVPDSQQQLQQTIEILEQRDKMIVEQRAYSEPFSRELFYEALCCYVKNPDIVYRQALLETGWFTHPRFTVYHNTLGMKKARYRKHVQSGVWKKHATYDHWLDSVKDYALWQEYWDSLGYNMNNYYDFLEHVGYATADHYVKTLKKLKT